MKGSWTSAAVRRGTGSAPVAVALLALLGVAGTQAAWAGTSSPGGTGSPEATEGAVGGGDVASLAEAQTSSEGVEVSTYGVASVPVDMRAGDPRVYEAVHAVQRVGERTVVYWSVGWEQEPRLRQFGAFGRSEASQAVFDSFSSAPFVNILLPEQGLLLYGVPDPAQLPTPRAQTSSFDAIPVDSGVMGVLYTVLPGLPAGVDVVDVTLGQNTVVTGVPVGEDLLGPTVAGPVVPLGSGWPEVPESFLEPLTAPAVSVRPLVAQAEQLDGAATERETGDEVSIDVSADVLFATDSATLGADAVERLRGVAAEVADRAVAGEVGIVGHTDSNAPEDYNLDLSRRRAQAVADVLVPLLPGDLSLDVQGRGETEPVGDNATEEGRQANRRVSVTFTEKPGND